MAAPDLFINWGIKESLHPILEFLWMEPISHHTQGRLQERPIERDRGLMLWSHKFINNLKDLAKAIYLIWIRRQMRGQGKHKGRSFPKIA